MAPASGKRGTGGRGLYERAGERSRSISQAHVSFLVAVQECEPRVLADLKKRALTLYRDTRARYASPGREGAVDAFLGRSLATMTSPARPDLAPLHAALLGWARRWNLSADWCLKAALEAMAFWMRRRPSRLTWGIGWSGFLPTLTTTPFTFEHAGWDPSRQQRTAYVQAVRKTCEDFLQGYVRGVDRTARNRGFRPAPTTREAVHFEWVARFQVRGESFAAIEARIRGQPRWAAHISERKAVAMAVKGLAQRIGLPLRPAPRGRPRTRGRAPRGW